MAKKSIQQPSRLYAPRDVDIRFSAVYIAIRNFGSAHIGTGAATIALSKLVLTCLKSPQTGFRPHRASPIQRKLRSRTQFSWNLLCPESPTWDSMITPERTELVWLQLNFARDYIWQELNLLDTTPAVVLSEKVLSGFWSSQGCQTNYVSPTT